MPLPRYFNFSFVKLAFELDYPIRDVKLIKRVSESGIVGRARSSVP